MTKRFFFAISVCSTDFASVSKTISCSLHPNRSNRFNAKGVFKEEFIKCIREREGDNEKEEEEDLESIAGGDGELGGGEEGEAHGLFSFVVDLRGLVAGEPSKEVLELSLLHVRGQTRDEDGPNLETEKAKKDESRDF